MGHDFNRINAQDEPPSPILPSDQVLFLLVIGQAKRYRLVVQSTSLEYPYQCSSSSLRCFEGRGGKFVYNQYTMLLTFFFIKNAFPSCIVTYTYFTFLLFFFSSENDHRWSQKSILPGRYFTFRRIFTCSYNFFPTNIFLIK